MITATAAEIFSQIEDYAASYSDRTERHVFPVTGQYVAQGDVNFLALDRLPKGVVPIAPHAQLVPGTTRGSRHCIALGDLPHVEFYAYQDPNPLEGSLLKLNGRVRIEHPEHGDLIYPPGTILAIGFQRSYAEEIKRIQD